MAGPLLPLVIDLDLDVFVSPVVSGNGDANYRADSASHCVAPEAEIRGALTKLSLSPERKTPGVLFDHHREAYFFWRDLIRQGRLQVPFDVIHVDAHSDLGSGANAFALCEQWAHIADKTETDPAWLINSSNYLAFALMNGWVRALINLRHPNSPDDVPVHVYQNFDPRRPLLTMKRFDPGEVARTCQRVYEDAAHQVLHEIHYAHGTLAEFKAVPRQPDFAFIARSPAFTPTEIDAFVPLARSCLTDL